ncbi:DUF3179 domain-containing protein [Fodinibius salsisoli]|uniref:DUF3179 domain-containing protein n=1 Tax=Fodinibius salsisoli TaxID=2820877 RepID=A0ABT3PSF0_9BACT|nr:DUF3179 domain-containing protein [Fodinibius salsisoli]MCW9708787.1 DUF3179 domain-containing protein [Fodinibius salsisoli]
MISGAAAQKNVQEWKTNTDKKIINLGELKAGGPPKDGIPSIDNPKFVSQPEAAEWLKGREPVIALEVNGRARAYPLQILIWHEIVSDRMGGKPVLVTFCPLCYSAIVFERTVEGKTLEFGVSGFLRHSDLVMFDRKTETLWQQFTGKAIVGDYVGTTLKQLPSQIISFEQFRTSYPDGEVLSRQTGYSRRYGTNPYTGYDDINNTPLFSSGGEDARLPPMEKVVGVKIGDKTKTYPYSVTKKQHVINDELEDTAIVVFHLEGARSALDARQISDSREDGSTGVFRRKVGERVLTFEYRSSKTITDKQTGSTWNVTGKAVAGKLKGKHLQPVTAGDYFAFAWLVFWPDTEIYGSKE